MVGIKEVLLLWLINILIKKRTDSGIATFANKSAIKDKITQNQQLAEELHKPIIRKFLKQVYLSFKDNIWGADLAYMDLTIKFNKNLGFHMCYWQICIL